jgi:hypothetical protein
MRRTLVAVVALVVVAAGWIVFTGATADRSGTYQVTATAIEACSCPLFCSCYYNPEPTGGHMCRFNNAYRFEEGSHWGGVDLSGAKVWMTGDLGGHFADGTTEWAVVTFDQATTPEQRAAIGAWAGKVFPVQWGNMETREDDITWEEGEKTAHAKMGSGLAEVTLHKVLDGDGEQATVTNTAYWAADSNTGFRLAHSDHYYKGDPSFSFEHRNGFLITISSEGTLPGEASE